VSDLTTLPKVLCGPMLRRVHPKSVTVFLALRVPHKVTLRVYAADANNAGSDERMIGTRSTYAILQNVHVVAVKATPSPTKGDLQPGTVYRYQLFFGAHGGDTVPVPETADNLFSNGVVHTTGATAKTLLLYPSPFPTLPSFVTPPATPVSLRLLHASCRKPHGFGVDMLPEADRIVERSGNVLAKRPQQLVLTGDQIYADDVADSVLAAIRDNGRALDPSRSERLPNRRGDGDIPLLAYSPGRRQQVSVDEAHFTSGDAKSHLMSFNEFVGMYLLVWSDVLWPAALPTFDLIYPDEHRVLGTVYDKVVAGEKPSLLEEVEHAGLLTLLRTFLQERARARGFRSSLPAVRRLLANTPTLMMFDDHEVTDDWYINMWWSKRASLPPSGDDGSALGRRIIQNGLAAYAVFQSWGNTPEQFDTDTADRPGRVLLERLAVWDRTESDDSREIATRAGLPTEIRPDGTPVRPAGALNYHYAVTWPNYQLIALDTRAWRSYRKGDEDPPALLWRDAAFDAMLPATGDVGLEGVTVVISPAPLLGVPVVEEFIQPLLTAKNRKSDDVTERYVADPEAWGGDKAAFHKVISRLFAGAAKGSDGVRRRRVVVLSGDVHHSFAIRLGFTAAKPFRTEPGPIVGVAAQLVSSSLLNEDAKTLALHVKGADPLGSHPPNKHLVGWENQGRRPLEIGTVWVPHSDRPPRPQPWKLSGSPAVGEPDHRHHHDPVLAPPEWVVNTTFHRHEPEGSPTVPPPPPPVGSQASPTDLLRIRASEAVYQRLLRDAQWTGREVVGITNVGEVSFEWGPGDAKYVVQRIHWPVPNPQPLTPPVAVTRQRIRLDVGQPTPGTSPLYGGWTLREGDHDGDPPRYNGTDQPPGTPRGHVTRLQQDLLELGFALVGRVTGQFDRYLRWAVREFQIYAKGTSVARDTKPVPRPPRYSKSLQSQPVPANLRYGGPISGVCDLPTQEVIRIWKNNSWRCPVVVEAWTVTNDRPVSMIATAGNLWRHSDMTSTAARVYVVDHSGRYNRGQRPADDPANPDLTVLGGYLSWSDPPATGGPSADPAFRHTWQPEGEMLPEHFMAPAQGGVAMTLSKLVADRSSTDPAVAALARRRLSTFKVVRAVSEVEAKGYFDGITAYGNSFLECGPYHWTAGQAVRQTATAPWRVGEGEIWAFLAYLQASDADAFARVAADFGLGVVGAWGRDGKALRVESQGKYASRPTLTGEGGNLVLLPSQPEEYDYFRTWHWFYRFAMAGRTIPGYRRRMWNMARQRLFDITRAPWDRRNATPTLPGPGGATAAARRRARIGDVYTSERAVAILLRWHVAYPEHVISNGAVSAGDPSNPAGPNLRRAHQRAVAARPELVWTSAPDTWTAAHETALIDGLMAELASGPSHLATTAQAVRIWPGDPARPGLRFSLPMTALPAAEQQLLTARGSFQLDSTELPNGVNS
jgi:hypothetical protein